MTDVLLEFAESQHLGGDFRLRATLNGRPAEAHYKSGALVADTELLERAKVLIALDETFSAPECERTIPAGLEDPFQAALTFVRASDRVDEFRLTLDGMVLTFATKGEDGRTLPVR